MTVPGLERAAPGIVDPSTGDRRDPAPVPLLGAPCFGRGRASMWRYREALPLPANVPPVSLGEGFVPLEPLNLSGVVGELFALRDDLNPSGSWKDRGSSMLITALADARGIHLVEDSSGNAALSLARYAAAADRPLRLFVPERANPAKLGLLERTSAEVVSVPGSREDATRAAARAAREGALWASHVLQPLHAAGAATAAFNVVEKLGDVPGAVIAPVGHGGLLAGLHAGFAALEREWSVRMPRLIGVQSDRCAPLALAFREGSTRARPASPSGPGLADGVLIAEPGRDREALFAARRSGGAIVAVDDLALERALRLLWLDQVAVEPTAALPIAWLLGREGRDLLRAGAPVVTVLTGHGMREGISLCRLEEEP